MTRILCVSFGSIGQRHVRNTRALLPDAEIGLYRQHTPMTDVPQGIDKVLPSLEAALAFEPDAVIVSSPASEHCMNALPFLERNIPVFLEKPLAEASSDAANDVARLGATRGFLMIGYVLRFLPALHAIKALIDNGELGKVHTAQVEVGQYLPDWRPASDYRTGVSAQAKLGGGALLELSHEIDYSTWLFGWPQAVQCSSSRLSELEIDVEDSATLVLEYPDKRVTLQLDFLQRVASMAVKIVGEKATLKADLMAEDITLYAPDCPGGRNAPCEKLPNGNDIYLRQFDFFFSQALAGYAPVYADSSTFSQWSNAEHALNVLRLVDLAKSASTTGHRQPFTPLDIR